MLQLFHQLDKGIRIPFFFNLLKQYKSVDIAGIDKTFVCNFCDFFPHFHIFYQFKRVLDKRGLRDVAPFEVSNRFIYEIEISEFLNR